MDSFFLNKKIIKDSLWVIFCIIVFIGFLQQSKQNNKNLNEEVKQEAYRVKVYEIEKEQRDYKIVGIDSLGHYKRLTISPFYDLQAVRPGDSLIKKPNTFEIRIVTKHKSTIVTPRHLPL